MKQAGDELQAILNAKNEDDGKRVAKSGRPSQNIDRAIVDGSARHFYLPRSAERERASKDTFCDHFGESDAYGQ